MFFDDDKMAFDINSKESEKKYLLVQRGTRTKGATIASKARHIHAFINYCIKKIIWQNLKVIILNKRKQ